MSDEVRDSYDFMARTYAELFLGDLDRDTNSLNWLAAFARFGTVRGGLVADLGCGPGHVTDHLSGLGLRVVGYDVSPGQIAEARHAFPDGDFHVGDIAALNHADSSLGGIVSRYSIIHFPPARLADVFAEWLRLLEPGAPALVSFFGSLTSEAHGTPFDHKVVTAYELFPDTIARLMDTAGFTDVEVGVLDPPEGGRPFSQATLLGRKPCIWSDS